MLNTMLLPTPNDIDYMGFNISKSVIDDVKLIPRDYQIVGTNFLRTRKRALLTDWPGLGKTLQAAEAAKYNKPVLIACPTYLVDQWRDFLETQYPDDVVMCCTGESVKDRFERQRRLNRTADWYIINVQMFRTFNMPVGLRTLIIDESHHVRNRTATQSKGAAALASDMNMRVYLLSATPMWKSAEDIWMQLHILQPEIFSSYAEFSDAFFVVDETPYGQKILGIKGRMRKELEHLLDAVRLGRSYVDVGRALPPTIKSNIKVEFPKEWMDKYKEARDNYILELENEDGDTELTILNAMGLMHTLRAITAFPGKVDAAIKLLDDLGKPAVIFTWYKEIAYRLADEINKVASNKSNGSGPNKMRRATAITGDITDPAERANIARRAMANGETIIATISSLSEGINLHKYRVVVFFEEHYAPGSNYQALSRVVRDRNDDGKDTDPVLVYYIMVRKTIDEIIHRVSSSRQATIKDIMKEVLI